MIVTTPAGPNLRVNDKGRFTTYVTLLKVLIMTRHSVTSRTILAGTTSVGMRKLTQDMTTKMAVGKYTLSK